MGKGNSGEFADNARIARAVEALADAMKSETANRAPGEEPINLIEWAQALKCMHASILGVLGANVSELAGSRLKDQQEREVAGPEQREPHGEGGV